MELLLTPLQFGIPNSRLRYYLLARKAPFIDDGDATPDDMDEVWRCIPKCGIQWDTQRRLECDSTPPIPSEINPREIRDYLDELSEEDASTPASYLVRAIVLEKWGRLFDIVLPSSRRTCCFTRGGYLFALAAPTT